MCATLLTATPTPTQNSGATWQNWSETRGACTSARCGHCAARWPGTWSRW
ncbi:hypothetical protein P4O66_015792 [Electrophorus voltai]|uniref:Uncharacterized protein n=1 Tax=Electrophorus voltai TaxID=2609070 RepID=A0AAD9DQ05_9TELE|nr:hypothetical protein P4O66_015792 [Electrophorus voltai]